MERSRDVITLDKDTIKNIFRRHFASSESAQNDIEDYLLLSHGAANTSYKVIWNTLAYVLRLYTRDWEGVDREHCLYELVHSKVSVPKFLHRGTIEGMPPYAIFEFVDKKHIFEIDDTRHNEALSYDLGSVLASIHSFHFPKAGLFGKDFAIHTPFEDAFSPYYEYIMDHFYPNSPSWKRLGDKRAKALKSFLNSHKEDFPIIHNGGVLSHSDYKPVNLLWSPQEGLTVLDWEFAHIGDPLIDFGILLRHCNAFPLEYESLEKGYKEHGGNLPDDWIRKAHITDSINLIQLLNDPSDRPQLHAFLTESVDKMLCY